MQIKLTLQRIFCYNECRYKEGLLYNVILHIQTRIYVKHISTNFSLMKYGGKLGLVTLSSFIIISPVLFLQRKIWHRFSCHIYTSKSIVMYLANIFQMGMELCFYQAFTKRNKYFEQRSGRVVRWCWANFQ